MQPTDQSAPDQPQTPTVPNGGSAPLAPSQDIQPAAQSYPPQPPTQSVVSPPQGGGGLKKVLILLLALVILGGVGFGIYAITKKDKTDSASDMSKKGDVAQLNVAIIGGSIALYPESTSDSYAQSVSQQIYEGLVGYESQTKIVPRLATGWSNPDSSTWDFDLRKNVTFHNGHTMKAADVVASLESAKKNEDLALYNGTLGDIKALNDYKVEIKTTEPDPFLLNKLTFLMVLDAKDIDGTDTTNATGPYQLKPGTKPTDSDIQLVAYDKYHGGHVYVRSLNITDIKDEETATSQFKAGKLNVVGEYSSALPDSLNSVKPQKIIVDDPSVTLLTINSVAAGPLQNVKVRQALRYSIDIPKLIKDVGITAEPASQLITKAIPGYDPSISISKPDLAKARQLLTEAGYPNGVTINVEASGVVLPIAQEIIIQAKAAGITMNLVTAPTFDDQVNDLLAGKTQTAVLSYASDLQDGSEVFDTVLRQTNNYKSAALDKYLDDASKTVDQEKRLKYLQQTSKSVTDDVAAIPLFNRQRTWIMDKSYAIQFDTVSADPGVYFWKAYLTN